MNKGLFASLILAFFSANFAYSSFRSTQTRYLSPLDFQLLLRQKFPVMTNKDYQTFLPMKCRQPNKQAMSLLGAIDPALEKPIYVAPSASFIRYYADCLQKIVAVQWQQIEGQGHTDGSLSRFLAPPFREALGDATDKTQVNDFLNDTRWGQWETSVQLEQVKFLVKSMIGPEPVIRDLTKGRSFEAYCQEILETVEPQLNELTTKQGLEKILLAVALKEEFLTY